MSLMSRSLICSAVAFLCLSWSAGAQTSTVRAKRTPVLVSVPFVGCKSDGQTGPLAAPRGVSKRFAIPADAAQRLAYYEAASGLGVLAPRGWYCFGAYGSSGSHLFLSPTPNTVERIFKKDRKGLTGPAIQLSYSYGDTSGRFAVARIIARVFPSHTDFVKAVIAEGIEEASSFPSGPYPHDSLKYLSPEMVEFTTPPNQVGLGTVSWLKPNNDPIRGVALLDSEEFYLTQLSVRLPGAWADLAPIIIHQVEPAK